MLRETLRKLLRRDVRINVSITPGCVISPGDLVVVSTDATNGLDVLAECIRERLPEGAEVLICAGSSHGAMGVLRLIDGALHKLGNERACSGNANPLRDASDLDDDAPEGRNVQDDCAIALEVAGVPVATQESMPHEGRP